MQIDFQSVNCYGESLCGDSYLCEDGPARMLVVHSDGMGHGPKANVLSELTCEILMSEWSGRGSIGHVMETLALRLPLCSVRGIGYSTFTLIDIDRSTMSATIVEYENPPTQLYRGAQPLIVEWESVPVMYNDQIKELLVSEFKLKVGDTIVVCSDGVTQSGLGLEGMPKGWGNLNLGIFVEKILQMRGGELTASELAGRIIARAVENERCYPRDDISAFVLRGGRSGTQGGPAGSFDLRLF